MSKTLAELGEAELLRRLAYFAPPGQLIDDSATIGSDPRPLLVNTDVLVDGIHFSDISTQPSDVGWRAVAANFSDLAASGAISIDGITVALIAPGHTPWSWVAGVYDGLKAALDEFGGVLLGGDCSKGCQRLLSVTALGRLGPLRLHRGDAQPGDILVTSGPHGLSRLGLALLRNDAALHGISLPSALRITAINQHQRPIPRLAALQTLLRCKPEALPWRAGGVDSSDGLLAAIQGLCTSSGCGASLVWDQLPRPDDWPAGELWDRWCLAGGEDFEIVVSLPPTWAQRWLEALPQSRRIGHITAESNMIRWQKNRQIVYVAGFDHYKNDHSE
ncbi:thiamine-phosphate kinase [Synechococcus sp. M16CYN]|uniref:thiamine-phosphate kinase n=1 Tax=Synechococcus sp. M16CYN TaxID=3103139 RepID=UPI0032555E6D